jgi:tetratricopeptide (TPR) repeat protein
VEDRQGAVVPLPRAATRQHYVRGRYLWSRRTAESLEQAIACFRRAIDEDCLDAAAWSGLADCYLVMASFEYVRPDVVLPRAIAAARKALELDTGSAEAHTSLAAATAFYCWDAEAAYQGFERAIALDPEYASAWHFYGVVLFGRGLHDRALRALERAQSLDPLSPIFGVQVASLHYLRREFRQAASLCDDLIRMDPDFWPARWFGGLALEQQGRTGEAARYLQSAVDISRRSHFPLAALGHLFATTGRTDEASAIAAELEQRRDTGHCSASAIAQVYTGLQEFNKALEWLHIARSERSPFLTMFLRSDPRLEVLRSEAQFEPFVASLTAEFAHMRL